jgi:hypothetical protein
MNDHREADLCAIGCKEDVFVDRTNINCQFNISMELDELCGNLDNALHYPLAIPPHRVTFILRKEHPQIALVAFTSLSVTSLPRTPPALTIALKFAVEGKIIFSNKSFA